jgi:aspartate aminotransferase-like enzyme
VLAATAAPMIHHRGPDFKRTLKSVIERLQQIFRTENEMLTFTSAGTGVMESSVANLCSPDDRVLVVSHGYFGERFAAMAETYGCDLVHLRYPWGESPSADEVRKKLDEMGGARAVFLTHSDTSTGVVSDLRSIAERLNDTDAILVVDAISSLAAVPLDSDAWGLDVVITSSHKALMCPPGLAFASVSQRALAAAVGGSPRYYFDWERTRAAQERGENPFSPAISLYLGLDVALDMLLGEGLEGAFERHVRLGRACRAGAKAMGLELFSPDEDRAAVVTAIRMPPDVDGQAIVLAMREGSGVTIIGGQGELRGKIVRIGHIGYVDVYDVTTALAALEVALAEAGADIERAVAVTAALEAFAEPVTV